MNKTKNVIYGDPSTAHLFEQDRGYTKEEREELKGIYNSYEMKTYKVGDEVSAPLVGESKDDYLFEASSKDYIRVPKNATEFSFIEGHKYGDEFDIKIIKVNKKGFEVRGSIAYLHKEQLKNDLETLKPNEYIESYVEELTPAGYNMLINHDNITLKAFMPHTLAGINKIHQEARKDLVGKTIRVMIESYSVNKGTYIVSRRKYLKSLQNEAIKNLNTEDVYSGHVTGTTPFGVFVEFNECLTGMIYKTNIHPEWQNKIQDIKSGTEIDFYVKEIIKNKKIILTQIQRDTLWDEIEVGDVYEAKVYSVKKFGILVKLDDETIGLIHTSEAEKHNMKKVEPGDTLEVRVLKLERMERKIYLTKYEE